MMMCKNDLNTNNEVYKNDNDNYPEFEKAVKNRFNSMVGEGQKLFKTNAKDLFDTYLANLPVEARQHYNCDACRSFFNRYGSLVTITEFGEIESVLWDERDIPSFFLKSVKAMKDIVLKSQVKVVFLSDSQTLGHPITNGWTHMSVKLPSQLVYRSRLLTGGQAMSEKIQDFQMLTNALLSYSYDTVKQALALIQSETMYRSDRVLGVTKWFMELVDKRDYTDNSTHKTNIVWLAVANAPTGFTHIKSSMVGTLLDDISDGLSSQIVASRFAEKMNPANFMRSQSAPTGNAIFEAEKIVEKLGIGNSLQRRYATIEEIPSFVWKKNKAQAKVTEKQTGGVFGHLAPKNTASNVMALPSSVMTWDKFQRTVMPTADGIEVLVDNLNRFMALVTAVDNTSENILQWDNTFSWYYHGGIDGEIKRRVEDAGGRYENNEIRASLIWEGFTDLDLHCITPKGQHVYYSNKRGSCGGYLDLDMNGLDKNSAKPVENMRWSDDAPQGTYKFYVHNYNEKVNPREGTPFRVEFEIGGKVYHYEGEALTEGRQVTAFEFDYIKGQDPVIKGRVDSSSNAWNVPTGEFVKVNGVTNSPNLWGKEPVTNAGTHVFFLLDGVKDLSEGKGKGFFNETLKPELRQIRKTLELFTANTPIYDADEATACGVGFSKDSEWNLTVKVTSGNSSRIVKIDRWD